MAIFLVHSPQVLEHDSATEVDDLIRLVVLVQPAVLLATGSVQAVLLSLSPTFLWRLGTASVLLLSILRSQHCSFSYVFRKQLFESSSLRCSSVAPFRLLTVILSETLAYGPQSSMKSKSSFVLYDLNKSNNNVRNF